MMIPGLCSVVFLYGPVREGWVLIRFYKIFWGMFYFNVAVCNYLRQHITGTLRQSRMLYDGTRLTILEIREYTIYE
jgi:hypothetical protein